MDSCRTVNNPWLPTRGAEPAAGDQPAEHAPAAATGGATSTDGGELPADLLAELRAVDVADTTPLEALNLLARLQKRVE